MSIHHDDRDARSTDRHLDTATLLLLAAGELPLAMAPQVEAHLTVCEDCRRQVQSYGERERALVARIAPDSPDRAESAQARRREVQVKLAAMPTGGTTPATWLTRGAMVAAALLLAVGAWRVAAGPAGTAVPYASLVHPSVRALPIRSLTPGATVALAVEDLCRDGEPREPLPVPEHVRADILRKYGMEQLADHEYELDYLITPALGGSPDPRNLWPEPYQAPVWNARVKDELEDLLPQLVCEGKVDLHTAQQEIAADWIAAYKKYFRTDRPLGRS